MNNANTHCIYCLLHLATAATQRHHHYMLCLNLLIPFPPSVSLLCSNIMCNGSLRRLITLLGSLGTRPHGGTIEQSLLKIHSITNEIFSQIFYQRMSYYVPDLFTIIFTLPIEILYCLLYFIICCN